MKSKSKTWKSRKVSRQHWAEGKQTMVQHNGCVSIYYMYTTYTHMHTPNEEQKVQQNRTCRECPCPQPVKTLACSFTAMGLSPHSTISKCFNITVCFVPSSNLVAKWPFLPAMAELFPVAAHTTQKPHLESQTPHRDRAEKLQQPVPEVSGDSSAAASLSRHSSRLSVS